MPERLGRNFCDPTILFKNYFMLFGTIFALNIFVTKRSLSVISADESHGTIGKEIKKKDQ